MRKIAFLYPCQGSQRPGMGRDIAAEASELFTEYLGAADTATALHLSARCLDGSDLDDSHVAQPLIVAHGLALTAYMRALGVAPDLIAGHSIGEYTAAVASGALSLSDGLRLTQTHCRATFAAHESRPGAMVVVNGLGASTLAEICAQVASPEFAAIANYNAPQQVVVSGTRAGVRQVMRSIRDLRQDVGMIPLPIAGGYHSPLMRPAVTELARTMRLLRWREPRTPLATNVSGALLHSATEVRRALLRQLVAPVQWIACVSTLLEAGCTTTIEFGGAQVLSHLTHMLAPSIETLAVTTLSEARQVAAQMRRRFVPAPLLPGAVQTQCPPESSASYR